MVEMQSAMLPLNRLEPSNHNGTSSPAVPGASLQRSLESSDDGSSSMCAQTLNLAETAVESRG